MKSFKKRFGLVSALFICLLISVGCSKGEDRAMVQPPENLPGEKLEPATPDASAVKSDITKQQQSREMPMPGQANDHSTLDPNATQKNRQP